MLGVVQADAVGIEQDGSVLVSEENSSEHSAVVIPVLPSVVVDELKGGRAPSATQDGRKKCSNQCFRVLGRHADLDFGVVDRVVALDVLGVVGLVVVPTRRLARELQLLTFYQ